MFSQKFFSYILKWMLTYSSRHALIFNSPGKDADLVYLDKNLPLSPKKLFPPKEKVS